VPPQPPLDHLDEKAPSTSEAHPSLVQPEMRFRTLEIRWHDSKPISSCDFQHIPFKKARPSAEKGFAGQSYRLATGGEDNHVRVSAPPGFGRI
jgi:hypothetical protein